MLKNIKTFYKKKKTTNKKCMFINNIIKRVILIH